MSPECRAHAISHPLMGLSTHTVASYVISQLRIDLRGLPSCGRRIPAGMCIVENVVASENKRDLAEVPDDVLNRVQPIFYTDPINASIRAMGLE